MAQSKLTAEQLHNLQEIIKSAGVFVTNDDATRQTVKERVEEYLKLLNYTKTVVLCDAANNTVEKRQSNTLVVDIILFFGTGLTDIVSYHVEETVTGITITEKQV